jgi:hypothetical protein
MIYNAGFAAQGNNHDVIQFNASMFSYLIPGMTQAQDLAAVLSHATTSGGTTTISDTLGDTLALSSISALVLQANPIRLTGSRLPAFILTTDFLALDLSRRVGFCSAWL